MYPLIAPTEYARLIDAAKRQANVLRDEAISDFWRQAGVALRSALMSAHRLACSLPRHGKSADQQGA